MCEAAELSKSVGRRKRRSPGFRPRFEKDELVAVRLGGELVLGRFLFEHPVSRKVRVRHKGRHYLVPGECVLGSVPESALGLSGPVSLQVS